MDDDLTEQKFPSVASGRAPDELLVSARQRGLRLRRRRVIALRAVPILAAVLLLPIAVLALRSPAASVRVTTPTANDVATTTTEQRAATTSLAASPTSTAAPTTTAATPRSTTTIVAAAAPTTTTAPPPPCARSESPMTSTTDKTTYAPGQTVTVTIQTTNGSTRPCYQPAYSGARVTDSSGATVAEVAVAPSYGPAGPTAVGPGQSRTTTWQWNQQGCSGSTCKQAGPGTYGIEVFFGAYPSTWTSPVARVTVGQ